MIDRNSIKVAAVIIATGPGEAMLSNTPTALHKLLGRPLIWYSIEAAQGAIGTKPVILINSAAEMVQSEIGEAAHFAIQGADLGIGPALMEIKSILSGKTDYLLAITASMPLLSSDTLEKVITAHHKSVTQNSPAPALTIATFPSLETSSFNRLNNADDDARISTQETDFYENTTSIYCFTADWLWQAQPRIPSSPAGDNDLLDVAKFAIAEGLAVQTINLDNPDEAIKIDNRIYLAKAETALQQRINERIMLGGVTLIDPLRTYIEPGVEIGIDTVIWPDTYLHGVTRIGENCAIGPNCSIHDTTIGNGCKVVYSVTEEAILEDDVDIGPVAHLRKGTHLAQGVHMGNFGEVKNSYLGPGTKMGHFSYIGDAKIGPGVNIGAGVITANYDGKHKHLTEIGAGAFIGSDTMLVAPLKIGEGARTGAGAVVTKDVPANTLAVGMPARAIRKKEDDDGS
jgi:bifunctional UDP-N-acetylglucosamine pyrophosphorylase/glucosamine-1-phosphate N-acetyltransferase